MGKDTKERQREAHPVIERLAHTEIYHYEVDFWKPRVKEVDHHKVVANAEYLESYIAGAAQAYYLYRLSQFGREVDDATKDLCAEIAFWWAANNLREQDRGMPVRELPTHQGKMS